MTAHILTIARYTALEALRTRLLWLLAGALLLALALAQLAGAVAITESDAIRSAVLSGTLRVFAAFMIALFVATSMVREFNDKGVDLALALPLPRSVWYLGKLTGHATVAVVTAALIGLVLLPVAPVAQVALWTAALACELLIVAAVSLLCVFTFVHVTIALTVVFAFYALARMIDAIQLIGHGPLIDASALSQRFLVGMVDAIALVLPALGRFCPSEWLVYHNASPVALAPILGQSAIFLVVVGAASVFDLHRRNL